MLHSRADVSGRQHPDYKVRAGGGRSFEPARGSLSTESQYPVGSAAPGQKRAGKPITPKERPTAGNVVDLMEALRRSVGKEQTSKATKKPREAAAGQRKMLLAIFGKKPAKENAAKKTASKPQRKSA